MEFYHVIFTMMEMNLKILLVNGKQKIKKQLEKLLLIMMNILNVLKLEIFLELKIK
jgi:hypothetical protein